MRFLPLKCLFFLCFVVHAPYARSGVSQASCEAATDVSASCGSVRNQGQANWCYGYATADLISCFQNAKGNKGAVSAFDLTVRTLSADPQRLIGVAGKVGDRELTSFAKNLASTERLSSEEIEMLTASPRKAILAYQDEPGGLCTEETLASEEYTKPTNAFFVKNQIARYRKEFESTPAACRIRSSSFQDLRTALNDGLLKYIREETDKSCVPRSALAPMHPIATGFRPSANSKASQTILNQLKNSNAVLISYDANFLQGGVETPVSVPDHHGVVVDARWTGTECEFKIKNTWGSRCDYYADSGFDKKCESGFIWVPETVVNARTYATVHIQSPSPKARRN